MSVCRVLLVILAALALGILAAGCESRGPEVCVCEGPVPEGRLSVGCGRTQCFGEVGYLCTGPGAAMRADESCRGPTANPRPPGTPDVMFVAVSGHCLAPCPFEYNHEYLLSQGTIEEMAAPFLDAGLAVEAVATTDNFFDEPSAFGFLTLVETLMEMRNTLVADWDNPTRFIVVGHSHGTVWAHLALHVLEQWGIALPVDVLVDIDGISPGWEDKAFLWFGDAWAPVIRAHMRDTGQTWPFDIASASDSIEIPGLSTLQDIEDVVPDSVTINLEVWSSDETFPTPVRDSQRNHRLDGSETAIFRFLSDENHEGSDDPGSDTVAFVVEALIAAYSE